MTALVGDRSNVPSSDPMSRDTRGGKRMVPGRSPATLTTAVFAPPRPIRETGAGPVSARAAVGVVPGGDKPAGFGNVSGRRHISAPGSAAPDSGAAGPRTGGITGGGGGRVHFDHGKTLTGQEYGIERLVGKKRRDESNANVLGRDEELEIATALGSKKKVADPRGGLRAAKPADLNYNAVEYSGRFFFREGLVPQAVWRPRQSAEAKAAGQAMQVARTDAAKRSIPYAEKEEQRRLREMENEVRALDTWRTPGGELLGESEDEDAAAAAAAEAAATAAAAEAKTTRGAKGKAARGKKKK